MKKFVPTFLLVLLIAMVFVVPAFAQAEIPPAGDPPKIEQFDYLTQLLIGLVTLAVTFGLKSLAKEWGFDITGKATQITATIIGALFESINYLLATVPPTYFPVVVAGLGFITSVLVAFGASFVLKKYIPVAPVVPAKKK
jgi:hypothetical protein